jgi:hypothetical protein
LYAIFPIGKYTTLSSSKVRDLWLNILDEINVIRWRYLTDKEKAEFFNKTRSRLEEANYQLNKFHYYNEIMIHCKEYYILSYNLLRDMNKEDFII